MAEYVKRPDKLGHSQHLIYVDYKESFAQGFTTTGMTNQYGDDAISSPYIDIYSFHNYNNEPHRQLSFQYQIELLQTAMTSQLGAPKPILLSEADLGVDGGSNPCHLDPNGNSIIRVRTLMASAFTGAAGAGLPWNRANDNWGEDENARLARYEAYLRLHMEGIDLDGENWTAGRSSRDDQNPATTTDDHRAAMLYLRRGDGLQATGFIQNLTYNFYTEAHQFGLEGTNCYDFNAIQEWDGFVDPGEANYRTSVNVTAEVSGVNALLVNGLNPNGSYQTAFYDGFFPLDHPSAPFVGPITTLTDGSGAFAMPFPDLRIPDYTHSNATPCFLFRTELTGNPFKLEDQGVETMQIVRGREEFMSSLSGNAPVGQQESSSTETIPGISNSLSVYPNPLTGSLLHVDAASEGLNNLTISYQLFDIAGKLLQSGTFELDQNILSMEEYAMGTYNLRISLFTETANHLIIKAQ